MIPGCGTPDRLSEAVTLGRDGSGLDRADDLSEPVHDRATAVPGDARGVELKDSGDRPVLDVDPRVGARHRAARHRQLVPQG